MSTNCVQCIKNERTGLDLLCDICRLKNQLEIAKHALQNIKDEEGKVCAEFEICKHVSCTSSCSSWFIAEKALKELEGK